MEALTFEQLPKAITQLGIELSEIKRLLQQKTETPKSADEWFDFDELINYLPERPAKATLYPKLANGEFPGHKRSKKWYFLKSEIDAWLKEGRKKTFAEIESEADDYLLSKKKRG